MNNLRQPLWFNLAWYGVSLGAVIALGLSTLYFPFGPDQATLMIGAERLDQGARLYAEFWDNKQPGLYWFHWLAGNLFGFSEQGMRTLELLWLLALSVILMVGLRPFLFRPYLSALAPVACVATYYASAREYELTQLEILVNLPIFLGLLALLKVHNSTGRTPLWWALSGIAAGITVVFKFLLAPIFILFWLWACWSAWKEQREPLLRLFSHRLLPAALGGSLVILALLGWFAHTGTLQQFLWTSFVYPPQALENAPVASPTRILTAMALFGKYMIIWLPFAAFALVRLWQRQAPQKTSYLLLWLLSAVLIFLVQRFSWWHYHTLLFMVPVGLLAVIGIDQALKLCLASSNETSAAWVATLLAVPLLGALFNPFATRAEWLLHYTKISGEGVKAFQWKMGDHYKRHWQGTRFLYMPGAAKGPIYVFGHPIVYDLARRPLSLPYVGFSWEFYLPEQIDAILAELEHQQVPYILVDSFYFRLFRNSPEINQFLHTHYRPLMENQSGRWFQHRSIDTTLPGLADQSGIFGGGQLPKFLQLYRQ